MSRSAIRDPYSSFMMAISMFCLLLVVAFTLSHPTAEVTPWRKPLIGSIFVSICVLGISATISPRWCSRAFRTKGGEREQSIDRSATNGGQYVMRGHHAGCGHYASHVLMMGGNIYCASCTGLLLGGLIALAATIPYFINCWQIEGNATIVYLGVFGVTLGLLQFHLFKDRRGSIRVLLNSFFAIGAALILVGIDALVHSLTSDLYLILSIAFWIFTRMSLSKWDHVRICGICGISACNAPRELASPNSEFGNDPNSKYDQQYPPEKSPK